jgi:bifunctional non-homologous end joining protein LigD
VKAPLATSTHPNKVFFPKTGMTKIDVVAYYDSVAPFILPHLKNRPLTLKLYPDGVDGKHIYLKDAPPYTPAWVKTFAIERKDKSHGRPQIHYVLANNRRTLLWTANIANLEMHTFLAKAPRIDRPLAIVFDLDPGPPATLAESCELALALKRMLERLHLEAFAKVSGSKGLHIYALKLARDLLASVIALLGNPPES